MKLTRGMLETLARIRQATDNSGGLMLLIIQAEGVASKRQVQNLRNAGLVEYCDLQLSRDVVDGLRVTDAGRAALTH